MWARAVRTVGNTEIKEVIPFCWLKNCGEKGHKKIHKYLSDSWMKFPLIKVKV